MGESVVECRACGRENRAGRRFCVGCGASLATGCPSCGAPFGFDERFCGDCGAELPAAAATTASPPSRPAAAPVAERRLVSVLFADLVGFTPFAEERDAEDVRETLTRYFDLASDVITRYGGTVEKFIGDAVMAVWGTPIAQENDAERAVRAALDLVDAVRTLGPTIQARAGVLTGEAAVTLGATNQGMVAGDIVNTAARLQSVAAPGTVLVGESTMRAASSAITFEPAGDQELKGKQGPVPAHRAVRVVAEVGGRNRQAGLEAPFVGRDDELRALKDQFHATARDRRTRLVSIIGPAGIGKSRLAWEFSKYADGLAGTIWWHQGRSPAYGQGVTFWALGEMVRQRCGLLEGADEASTRAAVTATLDAHVHDAAERSWIAPALLALLGVGGRATASEQLFAAWRTFFERLAATAPVVLLFEDLHWADTGTLDFIDHLLDWTRDLPILIVGLTRPELLDRRPTWGAGRRYFLSLALEPLPEPAMRELLAGLVPGLPQRAAIAIVQRADGIPLYAVETVRSLLADGRLVERDGRYEPVGDLSELAVPETLTALIASRLDALDPADRGLVQDASVLGQSFMPDALAALHGSDAGSLEPRLRGLVRRELLTLEADPRSPERGQYTFVQALIREVAYNTLAKKDRRAKHLAAARWFETLGSDELVGALARHYLAAWQNSPEGPEADALAGQARLALVAAADRAEALYANDQVVELLLEAITVTADPVERGSLMCRTGELLDRLSRYEEEERLGRTALQIATEAGDRLLEARAARVCYLAMVSLARRPEAMALIEATLDRVADLAPDPAVLMLERHLVVGHRLAGRVEEALAMLERLLAVAGRAGNDEHVLEMLFQRAEYLYDLGRRYEALALFRAVEIGARELGRLDLEIGARNQQVITWLFDRDPVAALEATEVILEQQLRTGDPLGMVVSCGNIAELALRAGDWDRARSATQQALDLQVTAIDRRMVLESAAVILALRGEDIAALVSEAEGIVASDTEVPGQRDRRATLAFLDGRYAEAVAAWRAFADVSPLNAPFATPKMARAYRLAGDLAGAREASERFDAMRGRGPVFDAERASLDAGVSAMEGRLPDALRGYRDARTRWQELRLVWDEAMTCFDMATLLSPDEPEVADAAAFARETMERVGARPFLALLDAVGTGSGAGEASEVVADARHASTVPAPG